MAHIAGMTYASSGRVYTMDESGGNFAESPPISAATTAIGVSQLTSPHHRVYVATFDGNVVQFANRSDILAAPTRIAHVTNYPVLWSLYHANGVLYLGTGDGSSSGPFEFLAIDDQTLAIKWSAQSPGPVIYPAGVAYAGDVPQQVIFASEGPDAAVRALDIASGRDIWSAPDYAFGLKVHDGVVYYANIADETLRARLASDGSLLWSFRNSQSFNLQRPVVAGGVVWTTSVGSQLIALRASDGTLVWEASVGAHPGPPAVVFDHLRGLSLVTVAEMSGFGDGFLRGFDANSGTPLWTSNDPVTHAGQSCTDPIIVPHFEGGVQVQLGRVDGSIATFSAYTGQLQWSRQCTSGGAFFATPHFSGW